jgi:hypothetical protein
MFESRKIYLSLVGVAWSSTTVNTVLTILETASLSTSHSPLLQIAAASSALDALSICCITGYAFQTVRQRVASTDPSTQARILVGLSISLSGIALIVSLALIGSVKSKWDEITHASSTGPVSDWTGHVGAQIAFWVFSCISQIVLYTSPFWRRQAPRVQEVTSSGPRDSVMSEIRSSQPSRNLFLMEPTMPSSPLAAAQPSPTFSSRSSHSLKSFRESLRHVVRPATSRTTLISRASFSRDARSIYSQSESFENVSHSDGFDSWDTSSVSLHARDVVMQSAPTRGRTLDPIPGSRPTTPGRPLDGSFLTELPEEDEDLPHPPKMMPDMSRPPSPAVSEAHIHPLFRSESPAPPPEATPGTSIIASPLSNQAIACPARSFNRMRSNSHLSQTHSTRGRTSSPHMSSRTPSPISRELTPPIPDYVLNTSPRSSMSGSRKVQLQYSPDR